MDATAEDPANLAQVLDRIRENRPRVHCITNSVAQAYTANMLLAAGALPSMTSAPQEIADFTATCAALLINLGTLDSERRAAIGIALDAVGARVPWVLDPVFVERAGARLAFARALLGRKPRVVRLNMAEYCTLFDAEPGAATMGADALMRNARAHATVIARTGARDHVADGARFASVANGSPLMAMVTAMGCAGSALVAAALAVEADAFRATLAALTILGVAGEIAAERAHGPGTFAAAILDAVAGLDAATLAARARVKRSTAPHA
ncbi:MAG: hydroxyethylthiazole kinase [Proteobacteria bacterium]|nr:hydroxyethylthiazole kinase [Pseudomonadota bacterium]